MRAARPRQLPVLISLALSIALHALAILPLFLLAMRSDLGPGAPINPRLDAALLKPPDSLPARVELGIEEGSPSTLNWIGYEAYEKHLALLADTEQPEESLEPPGEAAPPQPMIAQSAPLEPVDETPQPVDPPPIDVTPGDEAASSSRAPEAEPIEPADVLPEPPAPEDEPLTPADLPREPANPILLSRLLEELGGVPVPATVAVESSPTEGDTAGTGLESSDPLPVEEAEPAPPSAEGAEARGSMDDPAQPPSPAPSPSSPAVDDPAPAPPTPTATGSSVRQADRESDATGIVDVPPDLWQNGRPLAARGLELKPRRPVFPLLTQMTATPRNPLCVLSFRRDGRPASAAILQGSGDHRVDRAIESSLYGWRATGKALAGLVGKETIDITIRIILIEPRR